MINSPIIVALDFPDYKSAIEFAKTLPPNDVRLKVGKELFVAAGPAVVEDLQKLGFEVFLDLKFHDIPNTVSKACLSAAKLGVWMMNVHASGGAPMLRHVMDSLNTLPKRPILTAVTVLTSTNQETLHETGVERPLIDQVVHLAMLTQNNGADGVVCSALETPILRQHLGKDFILVTPGIRLADNSHDDQHRIMTPQKALANGADYLVIGRPITQAENPRQVIDDIINSIKH